MKNTSSSKSGMLRSLKTTAARVRKLMAEENRHLGRAKRERLAATLVAFEIGKLIIEEVETSYGSGALKKFAAVLGVSARTVYGYAHLARGAITRDTIQAHPELPREYWKILGSSIRWQEDTMGWMLHRSLVQHPVWLPVQATKGRSARRAGTDEEEELRGDVEKVKEVAHLLADTRRILKRKKLHYMLANYRVVKDEDGGYLEYQDSSDDEEGQQAVSVLQAQLFFDVSMLTGWKYRIGLDLSGADMNTKQAIAAEDVPSHKTYKAIISARRRGRLRREAAAQAPPRQRGIVRRKVFRGRSEKVLMDRKRFPSRSVDVVICDPPYSWEYYQAWREHLQKNHHAEKTVKEQAELVGKVASLLVTRRIIKEKFAWFSFCPTDCIHVFLPPILKAFRRTDHIHQILTWNKQTLQKLDCTRYFGRQVESIIYVSVGNRPLGVSERNDDTKEHLHSTLLSFEMTKHDEDCGYWKPVALLRYLVRLSTYDYDSPEANAQVVLDCFGGAGSTAHACIECRRDYRLIESHRTQYGLAKQNILAALSSQVE